MLTLQISTRLHTYVLPAHCESSHLILSPTRSSSRQVFPLHIPAESVLSFSDALHLQLRRKLPVNQAVTCFLVKLFGNGPWTRIDRNAALLSSLRLGTNIIHAKIYSRRRQTKSILWLFPDTDFCDTKLGVLIFASVIGYEVPNSLSHIRQNDYYKCQLFD